MKIRSTKSTGFLTNLSLGSFFLLAVLTTIGCKGDAPTDIPPKIQINELELRTELQSVFEKNELMGMSVLLLHDGAIVTLQNFGWRDSLRQLPINDSTYFRVASISKSFTAAAIMQLVEQAKLNLDSPVSTYLGWNLEHPKYPDQPITLRHLMSHTAGIRDGKGYGNFVKDMIDKELDIRELFQKNGAYLTEDMFAPEAPGAYFSYTNCTWGIIASVVEKVSGERFDQYCRKHIFQPMGIGTSFNVLDLAHIDNLAILYRHQGGQWKPQTDDYREKPPVERIYESYELGRNGLIYGPQGSVRSSAQDLANFSQMLMNNGRWNNQQILSPASVAQMIAKAWTYDGRNGDTWENFFLSYGLGMHRITNRDSSDIIFPDRSMVGHPGIAWGLLSDMYFDPVGKSGVVFITNGSRQEYKYGETSTFYQVEEEVFKVLYPHLQALEKNSEQPR